MMLGTNYTLVGLIVAQREYASLY